jgi:uncharacterized membrane protein YphA (DoxX/SURF4 family)
MNIDIFALFIAIPVAVLTALFVYFVRASSMTGEPKEADAKRTPFGKRPRLVGYWTSAIILSLVYISAGLPKLGEANEVLHRFSNWGYSEGFLMFIGVSEVIAGIFLLIPQTAKYAATYLAVIMVGAIYTHVAFDTLWWALLPAFCLSFLMFIAYEAHARSKRDAAREPVRSASTPQRVGESSA